MIRYNSTWEDILLLHTVFLVRLYVGGMNAFLIQLLEKGLLLFFVGIRIGIDEFVFHVFGISPEFIQHLLGFIPESDKTGRKFTFEIDLEENGVIELFEHLDGDRRKGIAFFFCQVEPAKGKTGNEVQQYNDGKHQHQIDEIPSFLIYLLFWHIIEYFSKEYFLPFPTFYHRAGGKQKYGNQTNKVYDISCVDDTAAQ
jgi:hypothetical protein